MNSKAASVLEFIARVLQLLRPKFYDKITWIVVISGVALTSTALWERVFTAWFQKEFKLNISGGSEEIVGFGFVVVGLVYHIATTSIYELVTFKRNASRREAQISHDKDLFNKSQVLVQETFLRTFLETLETDHSYMSDQSTQIMQLANLLVREDNRYLDDTISTAAKTFADSIFQLINFLSYKFYVYPDIQSEPPYRMCMTPTLNMDRGGDWSPENNQKYGTLTNELELKIKSVFNAYRDYRAAIKKNLFI